MHSDTLTAARGPVNADDSLDVFVVDGSKLLPGDIVLSTNRTSLVSDVIRRVTNSDFSHAAIVMYDSVCVEAVGEGVRSINLDRIHVADIANVRVLRLSDTSNRHIADAAGDRARSFLFLPYWTKGAISARLGPTSTKEQSDRFFCSHLVSRCYSDVGLTLLPDRDPETTVPQHFLDCPHLADVTAEVFVSKAARYAPPFALDTDGYPTGPDSLFVSLNQRIAGEMRRRMSQDAALSCYTPAITDVSGCFCVYFAPISLSEEDLSRYDRMLTSVLEENRLSEFHTVDFPGATAPSYMSIDAWEMLLEKIRFHKTEMLEIAGNMRSVLRGLSATREVFAYDLAAVQVISRSRPSRGEYAGAQALMRFYQERVEGIELHIQMASEQLLALERRIEI